jgi:actin-related protein
MVIKEDKTSIFFFSFYISTFYISLITPPMPGTSLGSPIIIDCGSGITKAGTIDDDIPSVIFPSLVGRKKDDMTDEFIGKSLTSSRYHLHLNAPIQDGTIVNWDDVEKLWRHAFELMKTNPEDHSVLLSEPFFNPKLNRELTAQILFESLGTHSLFLAPTSLLSLYSSGRITGIVLECGHGICLTAPYLDGISIPHSANQISLGGIDLTNLLSNELRSTTGKVHDYLYRGTEWQSYLTIQTLKEKMSRVNSCFLVESEPMNVENQTTIYELPDGKTFDIPLNPLKRCGEALFDPTICGKDVPGIHEQIYNTISALETDARRDLYGHIALGGGTGMLQGIVPRLEEELSSLAPRGVEVSVNAQPDRQFNVWIGGQILAGMSHFERMWFDKAEYDESGLSFDLFTYLHSEFSFFSFLFSFFFCN